MGSSIRSVPYKPACSRHTRQGDGGRACPSARASFSLAFPLFLSALLVPVCRREDECRTRPKGGASGLEIHAFRYEYVRSEQRQPRPCDAPTPQPRGEAGYGRGAARQFNLRSFVGHVRDLSIHVACSSRVRCLRVCVGPRARCPRTHARTHALLACETSFRV